MYTMFSFIDVYIWNDHIPINTSCAAFKSNTMDWIGNLQQTIINIK